MDVINSGPMPKPWEQRVAEPPSIERQMLLAQFACAVMTGYLAQGLTDANRHEIAFDCFEVADAMLAEFDKRVKR